MAPRMSDKASPRFAAGYAELDLIHYFMKPDHLTAAVAGSVTSATSERLATEHGRELSSAHTLTDERAQFFLVHNPPSFLVRDSTMGLAFAQHNKAG
jgi:hypothetical protein